MHSPSSPTSPLSHLSTTFPQTRSFTGNLSAPPSSLRLRRSAIVSASCATVEAAPTSFYEVLGIPVGACKDDIKAAYRRLARSCHPDVAGTGADEFIRVHTAYSTLTDPHKRADHDRRLCVRSPVVVAGRRYPGSSASPSLSFGGYPRRNWETDQCW